MYLEALFASYTGLTRALGCVGEEIAPLTRRDSQSEYICRRTYSTLDSTLELIPCIIGMQAAGLVQNDVLMMNSQTNLCTGGGSSSENTYGAAHRRQEREIPATPRSQSKTEIVDFLTHLRERRPFHPLLLQAPGLSLGVALSPA